MKKEYFTYMHAEEGKGKKLKKKKKKEKEKGGGGESGGKAEISKRHPSPPKKIK